MVETTTICYNPTTKFLPSNFFRQTCLKRVSFADRFSAPRSIFCGGFFLIKAASGRNRLWVSNTMDDLLRTSAFRYRNSDEGVQVLEQEALINGSSEFGSKFGLQNVESTLNGLSKWIIASLFGGVILWRHDAEAIWFAAGSVLNAMLSIVLKRILNQERPSALKSDPGMPSSHAQSIFFTVTFSILSSVECLGLNEFTITISGLALAFGSYFSYLRVSQQLHTVNQVLVGAAVGFIVSILWYWSWNAFILDAFVSSLWVRIFVVLGSVGICLCFLLYVVRHWFRDE